MTNRIKAYNYVYSPQKLSDSVMLNIRMKLLHALGLIILLAPTVTAYAGDERLLRHVTSQECGQCHAEIYNQWKDSMHANSTALKDPIHGAFYKAIVGSPEKEGVKKGGKYPVCLQCHAPAAAKDGKTDLTSNPAYNDGVNCVSCHTLTQFKGTQKEDGSLRLGMQAFEYSDTQLQGGNGSNIHPFIVNNRNSSTPALTANPTMLKTNVVCMGCHEQRNNSNKVALCRTGIEVASTKGATDCQLCHMPIVNGKADHSLMGGHSAKMVSKGLLMTMAASSEKNTHTITITLKNKLPHNFPTGAPFRHVFIRITGYNNNGQQVWSNSDSHPIVDDKKSVLMLALGDKNGKPTTPTKATKVLFDTRLKPLETKKITYTISEKGLKNVKAVAYYDLLLPAMKKKLSSIIPSEIIHSKIIATAEIEL